MEIILLGIFLHFVGGFASGSFYIPYKGVKQWSWESYWITGGIFSWLIVPLIAAYFTVPHFIEILQNADSSVLMWTYIFGVLWGIGGLTFGLTMRYLGLSLGMSVIMGLTSAFGALAPPIYRDLFTDSTEQTFTSMLQSTGGLWVLAGVAISLVGIAFCGRAGTIKEQEMADHHKMSFR